MANIDSKVIEAVAIGNLKSISEQPAMLSNLAYSNTVVNTNLSMQNAVANQQAVNELGVAIVGKTVNLISNLGPLESKSASEILTGNAVAEELLDLKASVQAFTSGGSAPHRHRYPLGSKENPLPPNTPNNPYHANVPIELRIKNTNQVSTSSSTDAQGHAHVSIVPAL